MQNKRKLFLGSSSQSRQMLLNQINIPFEVIGHTADEDLISRDAPFYEVLAAIARYKMDHVALLVGNEGDVAFVLTADSMGRDGQGTIHGKAKDREDALHKLKMLGQHAETATAFCLDRRFFKNGAWILQERIEKVVGARYKFIVPENWIDRYFENSTALIVSGAIAIELYGSQFLESIDGSYSTVVGLPLFELRCALEKLGFFE